MKPIEVIAALLLTAWCPVSGWSASETPVPDMEMLEFLGHFETSTGKPVDPLLFNEQSEPDQKKTPSATVKNLLKHNKKTDSTPQKDRTHEP